MYPGSGQVEGGLSLQKTEGETLKKGGRSAQSKSQEEGEWRLPNQTYHLTFV